MMKKLGIISNEQQDEHVKEMGGRTRFVEACTKYITKYNKIISREEIFNKNNEELS
jgi:hypothetical protein